MFKQLYINFMNAIILRYLSIEKGIYAMKKYPRTKATGRSGVNFVESIVSKAGSIFREIPEATDIGIDGYIEFVHDEIATGTLVGVQIKAGSSFLKQYSDGKYFAIRASKNDINYWNIQPIPVALIAYDPSTKLSGWLDVTGYIRKNAQCLMKKNTTLTIHSQASSFSLESFQGKFYKTFLGYRKEADIFNYANLMASMDGDKKLRGFLGLISHPTSRFSELTCYLLLNHLFDEHKRVKSSVTDAFSRYLSHPEVGFIPPESIRNYVIQSLNNFGQEEICRLLETAWLDDDRLMQRGSLGQCAGVIICNVPDYEAHLKYIATHNEFSRDVRIAALALADEFGMQRVLEHIVFNFDRVDWDSIRNEAKLIVETYAEIVHYPYAAVIEVAVENENYDSDDLANALRDAGTPLLVSYEYLISKIEENTNSSIVKFYAQQAIHKIMRYKRQI